jgi:hypothetical protein
METSERIDQLATALSAAQGELKAAPKSAVNAAFARGSNPGSKYATLADCVTTALPVLSKHKLSLMQGIHGTEFICRLAHASGQWMQQRVPIPGDLSKMTIQQLGAITTYLRRQTTGIFGLVADEDDDGNEAAKVGGWDHQPKGDLGKKVDTKVVNKYAKAIIDATDDTDKLWSLWVEVKEDHDLAVAVWGALPRSIKDRINDVKDAKKAA